jgi:hypothetical protein
MQLFLMGTKMSESEDNMSDKKMYFGNLKCVKSASGYDDYILEKFENDCRRSIEDVSSTEFETFMCMMNLVLHEGNFGPDGVTSEDDEDDGFTFEDARKTVLKTYRDVSFDDLEYYNPEDDTIEKCEVCHSERESLADEDGNCKDCHSDGVYPLNNFCIEGTEIKREFFKGIRKIYG